MKLTGVYLDENDVRLLKAWAAIRGTTISELAGEAIRDFIEAEIPSQLRDELTGAMERR